MKKNYICISLTTDNYINLQQLSTRTEMTKSQIINILLKNHIKEIN